MRIAVTSLLVAASLTVVTAAQQPTSALGRCCPTQASYEAAVRAFAHGDRAAASIAIAHAPDDQLRRAVSRLGEERGGTGKGEPDAEPLLEAACVMHLVLAESAVEAGHLDAASLQLQSSGIAFHDLQGSVGPAFVGRWYIAATGIRLGAANPDSAAAIAKQGAHDAPSSAGVRLAEGIVSETKADLLRIFGNRRPHAFAGGIVGGARADLSKWDHLNQRPFDLGQAEEAYRQALADDATSEEARLRLRRVLSLEEKDDEARSTLEALLRETHDARVEYLAHLFLADLAAHRKDSDSATQEYLAAIVANPSSQAAYFGLSNLALLAGDEVRARTYIRRWSTFPPVPDPWTPYRQGLDQLQPALIALLGTISQ